MNRATYFRHIELLAGQPDAVAKLAKQKRIVARAKEWLRWRHTLKFQLHPKTHTLDAHLLNSTRHHLLAA